MPKNKDYVEIPYDNIRASTPMAVLFIIGDEEVWIPKSQINMYEFDEENPSKEKIVFITQWMAQTKGLI